MNRSNGIRRSAAWLAIGLLGLLCTGCGSSDPQSFWQSIGGTAILNEKGEVESLYLGQTSITDAELGKLQALPHLKRLFLNGTKVTDDGMQHLQKLDQLVHLDLDQTQVSDAGILLLLELKKLRSLNLLDTKVTTVAMGRFQEELPQCRVASLIVHPLNDPGNNGGNLTPSDRAGSGDDTIANSQQAVESSIAKQFKKPFEELSQTEFDQLRTLYLVDDKILDLGGAANLVTLQVLILQSKSLRHLHGIEKLSQLTKLTVRAGKQIDDLGPLSGLKFLEELALENCRLADLTPLTGLLKLQVLDIRGSEVASLELLRPLKSLRKLWLPANQVSDLEPLRELSQLKDLYLADNPVKVLEPLHELKSLELLDVRRTQVNESEVEKFKAAVPDCKVRH